MHEYTMALPSMGLNEAHSSFQVGEGRFEMVNSRDVQMFDVVATPIRTSIFITAVDDGPDSEAVQATGMAQNANGGGTDEDSLIYTCPEARMRRQKAQAGICQR